MAKIKLNIIVTFFEEIDPQDWLDEFCEENGVEDKAVDQAVLEKFAVERFTSGLEDGETSFDDMNCVSMSVEQREH